jgi:hypothetical protein
MCPDRRAYRNRLKPGSRGFVGGEEPRQWREHLRTGPIGGWGIVGGGTGPDYARRELRGRSPHGIFGMALDPQGMAALA